MITILRGKKTYQYVCSIKQLDPARLQENRHDVYMAQKTDGMRLQSIKSTHIFIMEDTCSFGCFNPLYLSLYP